jgi:hypothetical protein
MSDNPFLTTTRQDAEEASNPFFESPITIEDEIESDTQAGMEEVVSTLDSTRDYNLARFGGEYDNYLSIGSSMDVPHESDPLMAARAFLDMQTLGFADEAGAAVASIGMKMFEPELFQDVPFTELYRQNLGELNTQKEQYQQEYPVESFTAGVAGTFASPANIAFGGLLKGWSALRSANQARNTVPPILGGTPQAAAQSAELAQKFSGLSPTAFNLVNKTPILAPVVGGNAILGGAYGAGLSEEGHRLQGAETGAAFGAAIPLVLKSAGLATNELSRLRSSQPLGKGKDFINIMLTDSGAANFYRTIVAKGFLGGSLIESQVRRSTGRFTATGERLVEQARAATEGAKLKLNVFNARSERAQIATKEVIKRELADASLALKETKNSQLASLDELNVERVARLDASTTEGANTLNAALLRELDAATNMAEAGFRTRTLVGSLPSGASQEVVDSIGTLNPQEALQAISKEWQRIGFSSAKSKTFSVDSDTLIDDVLSIFNKDADALALSSDVGVVTRLETFIRNSVERLVVNGKIDGSELVDLRSRIGSLLNGMSENKGLIRGVTDKTQTYFDDLILGQLNKADADAFLADRGRWAVHRTAEDSIFRATKGANQGSYTAEDWIAASKGSSRYLAARGQAPFQAEAAEQAALNKQRDLHIKTGADEAIARLKEAKKSENTAATLQLNKQKAAVNAQYSRDVEDLRTAARGAQLDNEAKEQLARQKEALRMEYKERLSDVTTRIDALKAEAEFLDTILPKGHPSIFEKLFADGVVGQIVTLGQGEVGVGTILKGSVGSLGFAFEGAQRAFVGQTGAQQSAQALLQRAANTPLPPIGAIAGLQGSQRVPEYSTAAKNTILASPSRSSAVLQRLRQRNELEILRRKDPEFVAALERKAEE